MLPAYNMHATVIGWVISELSLCTFLMCPLNALRETLQFWEKWNKIINIAKTFFLFGEVKKDSPLIKGEARKKKKFRNVDGSSSAFQEATIAMLDWKHQ